MSNAPTVLLGLMPLLRAVVRSSTSATATAVTADDSGTLFVDLSTSSHTYTLPTLALGAGKHWLFFAGDTTASTVITGGDTDKILGGDNAAADTMTSASVLGDWALVVCDGTWYYFICGSAADSDSWDASG